MAWQEQTNFPPTLTLHDKEGKNTGAYLEGNFISLRRGEYMGKPTVTFLIGVMDTNAKEATVKGDKPKERRTVPVRVPGEYQIRATSFMIGAMRKIMENPAGYAGCPVRMEYHGLKDTGKPQPAHDYRVFLDDEFTPLQHDGDMRAEDE